MKPYNLSKRSFCSDSEAPEVLAHLLDAYGDDEVQL